MPHWYPMRLVFLRIASVLLALSSGGALAVQPIICSRAGRIKAKNVTITITITITGLPGRANKMAEPKGMLYSL